MALHRRHPMGSARKSAAAIVTASGSACKIAVTLAKGIYLSAVKKAIVVQISAPTRNHIRRMSCLAKLLSVILVTQTISKTGGTVMILRKNTAWNKAISENKKIKSIEVQQMIGMGTPEDLRNFEKKIL